MYRSLLLATDGSENSMRAAKEAVKIASLVKGAEVTILYVIDSTESDFAEVPDNSSIEFELARKRKVQPIINDLEKEEIFYKVEMNFGIPSKIIIEVANQRNFDMLVMGKRGLNPMQEMIMGSVSRKVLSEVNCPVLVVK